MLFKFHDGTTVDPSKVMYSYIENDTTELRLKICFGSDTWIKIDYASLEDAMKATDKLVRASEISSESKKMPKKKSTNRKIR